MTNPFPKPTNTRVVTNRYRKVWKALIAHREKVGMTAGEWSRQFREKGYAVEHMTVCGIVMSISMRHRLIGFDHYYYGVLASDEWTIVWTDINSNCGVIRTKTVIGFDGDRAAFERDFILLAMNEHWQEG